MTIIIDSVDIHWDSSFQDLPNYLCVVSSGLFFAVYRGLAFNLLFYQHFIPTSCMISYPFSNASRF